MRLAIGLLVAVGIASQASSQGIVEVGAWTYIDNGSEVIIHPTHIQTLGCQQKAASVVFMCAEGMASMLFKHQCEIPPPGFLELRVFVPGSAEPAKMQVPKWADGLAVSENSPGVLSIISFLRGEPGFVFAFPDTQSQPVVVTFDASGLDEVLPLPNKCGWDE